MAYQSEYNDAVQTGIVLGVTRAICLFLATPECFQTIGSWERFTAAAINACILPRELRASGQSKEA